MPDPRVDELLEQLKKLTRAQTKLGLRLEEVALEVQGGFAQQSSAPARPQALRWDDLLDAMDLLDEAVALIDRERTPGLAEGLSGVASRLGRFLTEAGLDRQRPVGRAPDGKRFKVVGTESVEGAQAGTVTRVVRSAVLEGKRLLREGEVIVQGARS